MRGQGNNPPAYDREEQRKVRRRHGYEAHIERPFVCLRGAAPLGRRQEESPEACYRDHKAISRDQQHESQFLPELGVCPPQDRQGHGEDVKTGGYVEAQKDK